MRYMPSPWRNASDQIKLHHEFRYHFDLTLGRPCFRRWVFEWLTQTLCRFFWVFLFVCLSVGFCPSNCHQPAPSHLIRTSKRVLSEEHGMHSPLVEESPEGRRVAEWAASLNTLVCESYHFESVGNTTCGEQAYFKIIIIQRYNFLNVE